MLRWRLLLGTVLTAALAGLCWQDYRAEVPGVWLLPVVVLFVVLATQETLGLAAAAGLRPVVGPVYAANLLLVLVNWLPWTIPAGSPLAAVGMMAWVALTVGLGLILVFLAEIRRYEKPGGATANIAAALAAIVYVGVMFGFVVQLRLLWGIGALASMLLVVKMGDIGAYTVGRLIGRHKMAPRLSPGKTMEGAAGALVFSAATAWATFRWLMPAVGTSAFQAASPAWGWLVYGLLVGGVGLLGDLAESLLKRDVGRKDSSTWLPGFGGVLDMVDSILLAAPVAWACWMFGLVGR